MASSSSSSSSLLDVPIKHDVFISFRGEDIRTNLLGHLRKELHRNYIDFFIDDVKIHPGDEISSTLLHAIEGSLISLVIFSENYASSAWCLNELVKVIECMKQHQRIVIPVFYNVLPSDVRYQKNSFKEAFDKHQHRFKGDTAKVQSWRSALKEASNLSGFHYPSKYLDESKFIEEIVKDISEKLSNIFSRESNGLVGIDDSLRTIESLLEIESSEVRIIGIWGMGGIGKTTIAEFLFDKYSSQYEGSCMLKNVREESQKYGVPYLCEKLISELLVGESLDFKGSSKARSTFAQRMLTRKKVFIVLDDMDTSEEFEHLAAQWLGPGSRIIVTTRDKHVLRKVQGIYEVKGLSYVNSFKLFCLNAFEKVYPEAGYEEVSEMAVNYANGIPLALKVLGSLLYSKAIEEWGSALAKLKIYPNKDIFNVLKLSYDGLDELEKEIFLDIVFFFKGEKKDVVIPFLEACGFFPAVGIANLSRKALITISEDNEIEMHDLIEQMGREIVRRESIKEPGRRSRLSNSEDVYKVLNNNKGTDSVEGIVLDLYKINRDLHLDADTFKKMPNIRFLKFYYSWGHEKSANVSVSSTLETFPNELRYLEWSGYPLKSLPPSFCAEKLVELSMPDSQVSKLWDGVQDLVNLKRINLEGCKQLVELPDFTQASNLKKIQLNDCVSLCQLHPSMLSIHNLETLSVWGCKALKSLKSKIHLKSLQYLDVRCCSSLNEFSVSSEELTSLNFNGTIIDSLHSSISRLSKLVLFDLSNVRLEILPNELCLLVSLEVINLKGCKQLIELPHDMKALSRLKELNLDDCFSLRFLPELPASIIHLSATNCTSLEKLFNIKTVFSLNLKSFSFENCERLDEHSIFEYVQLTMMGVAIRDILGEMLQYKFEPHADDDDITFFPQSNSQVFYPGIKVPPWFTYQTRRALITIDLPGYQSLNPLVGFILCCVVDHIPSRRRPLTTSPWHSAEKPPIISCQFGNSEYSKRFAETTQWNSDLVCIWFTHASGDCQWLGKNTTFKFKAETLYADYLPSSSSSYRERRIPYSWCVLDERQVIGCGVQPVYASDIFDIFPNVDPHFQFFKDRPSYEREGGFYGKRRDFQLVYTLDQVKTCTIQKMEEEQQNLKLQDVRRMRFWLPYTAGEVSESDSIPTKPTDRIKEIENRKQRKTKKFNACSSLNSVLPSGSKKVPQSLDEEEKQGVQRNNSIRLPSWRRLATKIFKSCRKF
ncbi:hypothetical protein PIB30_056670 [Stylosanthes scabra]|uniref:ADP-ribosyl cyclase/cyclic ADP-ribose hydrolase n=1 Tax=Stylosanthes scabra TaxID=79078 RepID=A0ABU6XJA6_9FABA|nr:hypothetical protein [Stylosanthes scabra]